MRWREDRGVARTRIAFLTFGCRVNQYETDSMRALLEPSYEMVEDDADIYILNGCSVTGLAEKKARQALHRIRRSTPGALIIVTGCLADAVACGLSSLEPVDLVAGNAWKLRIPQVVAEALTGRRGAFPVADAPSIDHETTSGPTGRVRAYLKIQDGCSGSCSYCRAVQLRGGSRCKSAAVAESEARRLVDLGFREIVLTGVNIAEYASTDGGLAGLVRRLLAFPELRRLRLASINVTGITDALLDAFAADARLCAHFHMPLQSGDDRVLRAMRRSCTADAYRETVSRIRRRLPDAMFGSDVIVGFPGEDEDAFAATCRMVEDVGFSNLHVFRFSPRSGTEAARLPHAVPEAVKRDRALRLGAVWEPQRKRLLDARVGKIEDVLVEARQDGRLFGHGAAYLDVAFTSTRALSEGELCRVRVTRASESGLEGVHDDQHSAD
jgi:threonylcarbamoyladenosine tRNA methylthiotransferase MtaB